MANVNAQPTNPDRPYFALDTMFGTLHVSNYMIPDGVNHWNGRQTDAQGNQIPPIAICYHITDSDDIGSVDAWFADPVAQASAHFCIDRDGSLHQYVFSGNTAWSNGKIDHPNGAWISWIADCERNKVNANFKTISIEHVGRTGQPLERAQIDTTIALSSYLIHRYNIAVRRENLVRHSDFDTVTRAYCPGTSFPLDHVIQTLKSVG